MRLPQTPADDVVTNRSPARNRSRSAAAPLRQHYTVIDEDVAHPEAVSSIEVDLAIGDTLSRPVQSICQSCWLQHAN
eukprot:3009103-Amphidinium_carterae.1